MSVANDIINQMMELRCEKEAKHLMRFFKTAPGEYGEGDKFLGIRVPVTRDFVRRYRRDATMEDVDILTSNEFHEIRLSGFLLLLELYLRARRIKDKSEQRKIVDYYLGLIDRSNNWDLVDLVCYKLLGDWLTVNPEERERLYHLAAMDGKLWHQRVAIVSTFALIKNGEYEDSFRLSELYFTHPHDLIHKASGWMLREVGKRGGRNQLIDYLDRNATRMPRTMLRYAIEHLSPDEREHYLTQGR